MTGLLQHPCMKTLHVAPCWKHLIQTCELGVVHIKDRERERLRFRTMERLFIASLEQLF